MASRAFWGGIESGSMPHCGWGKMGGGAVTTGGAGGRWRQADAMLGKLARGWLRQSREGPGQARHAPQCGRTAIL